MPPFPAEVPSSVHCGVAPVSAAATAVLATAAFAALLPPARARPQPTTATVARSGPSKSMIMCVNVVPPCGSTTTREPPPRYSARYIGRSLPSRPIASSPVGTELDRAAAEHRIAHPAGDAAEQRAGEIGHLGRDAGRAPCAGRCRATPSARAAGSSPARAAAAAASSAAPPRACAMSPAARDCCWRSVSFHCWSACCWLFCCCCARSRACCCSASWRNAPGSLPNCSVVGGRLCAAAASAASASAPAATILKKGIAFMAPPRRFSPRPRIQRCEQPRFRRSPLPGRYRRPAVRHSSARSSTPRAAGRARSPAK